MSYLPPPFWVNIYKGNQRGRPLSERWRWKSRELAEERAAIRVRIHLSRLAYRIKVIPKEGFRL